MSAPRVSIVTPSFNQGRFLGETLASVAAQTYPAIEHIVIDGGSTDTSTQVIADHAAHLAYWESTPDEGFGHAINKGFARSTGEIVAYLNSDDLLAPNAVAEAVAFLEQHPHIDLVYGNRIAIDEHGHLLYVRPSLPLGGGTPYSYIVVPQETCFWRRRIHDQVGGIDERVRFAIDYDLFSRIAAAGRVAHHGHIWGYFRRHPGSKTSSSYATLGKREVVDIQRRHWQRSPSWHDRAVHAVNRGYALAYGAWLELTVPRRLPPLPQRADAASLVGVVLPRLSPLGRTRRGPPAR
jgi:glycosyltransferase involved in cell wall biosynthesis